MQECSITTFFNASFSFQILEATEALNSRIVATLLDVVIGPDPAFSPSSISLKVCMSMVKRFSGIQRQRSW